MGRPACPVLGPFADNSFCAVRLCASRDLLTNPQGARVTRGLIALTQTLETSVVAKGVKEEPQVGALLSVGSNLAQGYLLSRPLASDEFETLLNTERASKLYVPAQRLG